MQSAPAERFPAPGWIVPKLALLAGADDSRVTGNPAEVAKSASQPEACRLRDSQAIQIVSDRHDAGISAAVLRMYEGIESP